MPTIQKLFFLEITPERFVDNCSESELRETAMLIEARLDRLFTTSKMTENALPQSPQCPQSAAIEAAPKKRGRRKKSDNSDARPPRMVKDKFLNDMF
jgi:hypothetical protein